MMYKSIIKWYHYIPCGIMGGIFGGLISPVGHTALFILGLVSISVVNASVMLLIEHHYQMRDRKALNKGKATPHQQIE